MRHVGTEINDWTVRLPRTVRLLRELPKGGRHPTLPTANSEGGELSALPVRVFTLVIAPARFL